MTLDLPLIWAGIIAVAVLIYVLLDGFDLGIGILFPFAGSPAERDVMMDTIAPVWDGNETWLVLGGGGLFAAFPLAYAVADAGALPARAPDAAGADPARRRLRVPPARPQARQGVLDRRLRRRLAHRDPRPGPGAGRLHPGRDAARTARFAGGPFDWLTPYTLLVAGGPGRRLRAAGRDLADLAHRGRAARPRPALGLDRGRRGGRPAGGGQPGHPASSTPRSPRAGAFEHGAFDLGALAPLLPIPLLGVAGLAIIGCRPDARGRTACPSSAPCWSSCRAISAWRRASSPTSCPTP